MAFLLPVVRLAAWAVGEARREPGALVDPRFAEYLANSLTVAVRWPRSCVAALARASPTPCGSPSVGRLLPAAGPGHHLRVRRARRGHRHRRAARRSPTSTRWSRALGVEGGTGLLVTGSVLGILYAYVIRFLAPAYQAVDASLTKVSASMTASALSLGARPCAC